MKLKKDIAIVLFLIAFYTVIFSYYSILRHDAFASNYDLGNMDQTIWNTLHGNFFTMSTVLSNTSRLATHADFILILLSPIYLFWDNVRILLIIQSFLLALGALPVFFIAKKILKDEIISIIFVLVYLLNPGLQKANLYDFHGVVLAIPSLLSAFYFALTKRWKLYWLFFFISIITKEQVSIVLAIMGLLIALSFKERKVGFISFLIGVFWFSLMVFYIMPTVTPTNQHWAFDLWFAKVKEDIDALNIVGFIGRIWTSASSEILQRYYFSLLLPFGLLPLLGFPWVLMALPDLIINTVSAHEGMRTINYHYQSTIIAGFTISVIFAFSRLNFSLKRLVSIFLLPGAIWFSYLHTPLPVSPNYWFQTFNVSREDREFEKVLQALPKNAVISASGEIRSHVTHRFNAFNIPTIPENVEYVALIDEDRLYRSYQPHNLELAIIEDLKKDKNFHLVYQKGHFYLFKKLD